MKIEEYITSRVDNQITWLSSKSSKNKKINIGIKTTEIFLASILALGSGFLTKNEFFPLIVGVIGFVIAVLNGINSINKYQENWLKYRATSEILKSEKYKFLANSSKYSNCVNKNQEFIENIETILNNENKLWQEISKSK
jgi:hypothetical protein